MTKTIKRKVTKKATKTGKNTKINAKLHRLPSDMRTALVTDKKAWSKWESLTPLAKNEWICWTTTVKQEVTRQEHIKRATVEIAEGQKRPCCWPGCPHRRPQAAKYFHNLKI